jgi:tRNA (guanosine-2'-O-)-methyltransferase
LSMMTTATAKAPVIYMNAAAESRSPCIKIQVRTATKVMVAGTAVLFHAAPTNTTVLAPLTEADNAIECSNDEFDCYKAPHEVVFACDPADEPLQEGGEVLVTHIEWDDATAACDALFDHAGTGRSVLKLPHFPLTTAAPSPPTLSKSPSGTALFRIGYICGPSGTAKSVLRQRHFGADQLGLLDWPQGCSVFELMCASGADADADAVTNDEDGKIRDHAAASGGMDAASAVSAAAATVEDDDVRARLAAVQIDCNRFGLRCGSSLSAGEKFQVGLARLLRLDTVVVDEFTSSLDRATALAVAAGVQRYVRVQPCKKTVVFAGCHADVIAALAPDWLFDTGARILHDPLLNMAIREAPSTVASERCGDAVGLLHTNTPLDLSSSTTNEPEQMALVDHSKNQLPDHFRESVARALGCGTDTAGDDAGANGAVLVTVPIPVLNLVLQPSPKHHWRRFRDHHYKTPVLSNTARTFLLTTADDDQNPVGMVATIRHNGPKSAATGALPHRAHRTVVLPQWQGLGIGSRLSDAVAELHRQEGSRYYGQTVHPMFGRYRDNSEWWVPTEFNHRTSKFKVESWAQRKQQVRVALRVPKYIYSHEYTGPPSGKQQEGESGAVLREKVNHALAQRGIEFATAAPTYPTALLEDALADGNTRVEVMPPADPSELHPLLEEVEAWSDAQLPSPFALFGAWLARTSGRASSNDVAPIDRKVIVKAYANLPAGTKTGFVNYFKTSRNRSPKTDGDIAGTKVAGGAPRFEQTKDVAKTMTNPATNTCVVEGTVVDVAATSADAVSADGPADPIPWAEIWTKHMPMCEKGVVLVAHLAAVEGVVLSVRRLSTKLLFLELELILDPEGRARSDPLLTMQLVLNLKWAQCVAPFAAFMASVQVGDTVSSVGHPGRTRTGSSDNGVSMFGISVRLHEVRLSPDRVVTLLREVDDGALPPFEAARLLGASPSLLASLQTLLAPALAKRNDDKTSSERGQRRRQLRKLRATSAVVGPGGDEGGGAFDGTAVFTDNADIATVAAAGHEEEEDNADHDQQNTCSTERPSDRKSLNLPPMTTVRLDKMRAVAANRQAGVYVVLEEPWNAGNVAAVLRSCDAFGVTELLLVGWKNGSPATDQTLRKRSASASLWVPTTLFPTTEAAAAYLATRGAISYGTTVHSSKSVELFAVNFRHQPSIATTKVATVEAAGGTCAELDHRPDCGPIAVWFGNEAEGLSVQGHEVCNRHVFIPMHGMVESHNLASSVAIVLCEVSRQRAGREGLRV